MKLVSVGLGMDLLGPRQTGKDESMLFSSSQSQTDVSLSLNPLGVSSNNWEFSVMKFFC